MTIRCLRCGQKTPGLSLCWRRAASNGARLRKPIKADAIASLDGRLVVGIDEDGARYFKRLRCHDKLVVLESLNPDGSTATEVLSLDSSHELPKLTEALEVIGVLFELPNAKEATAVLRAPP